MPARPSSSTPRAVARGAFLVMIGIAIASACSAADEMPAEPSGLDGGLSITHQPRLQPMLAAASDAYRPIRLWPNSEAFLAARDALEQPCQGFDFQEVGLREIVASVAAKAGVDISIDWKALEDQGYDIDVPVTARAGSGTYASCLRTVLDGLGVRIVARHDRVVLTTTEQAAGILEKIFYPLLPEVDADAATGMILELVAPDSWSMTGGSGGIVAAPAGMGHGLLVAAVSEVHDQVEAVLRGLDATHWEPEFAEEGVQPRFIRIYEIADEGMRDQLAEQLKDLVNDSLPHGADADAQVSVIGTSLVIRSRSRPFQVMACHIVAALTAGEKQLDILIEPERGPPVPGGPAGGTF